ncbi:MAG: NUDIX domain-containing protein [Asticcacaulis sp.]
MNIVLICRFHPLHSGHIDILKAAQKATGAVLSRLVVVVVGMQQRREARYPWTTSEQAAAVASVLGEQSAEIIEVGEYNHDADLLTQLQPLLGAPDNWSWGVIEDDFNPEALGLKVWSVPDTRADTVRLRDEGYEGHLSDDAVASALFDDLRTLVQWDALVAEHRMIRKYMQSWALAPYPVNLVTADSVLYRDGAILLIQRAQIPGKDLWALPGGFVETDETLMAASLREVAEETGLHLSSAVLKDRFKGSRIFDRPHRCSRGRTVTHGFIYDLSGLDLPPAKAGDDAAATRWVSVEALESLQEVFFQDHYHIADDLLRAAHLR